MDYIGILQEILQYIDDNIKGKLSVEKLAARAGFSSYHFCRVFQWNIGYSIMEYVRKRRLAFAASELTSTKRIIDIAFEYGYETHTGFTKAFKQYFGCTPEIYRIHDINFDVPKLPVLEKTKQYVDGGIVMEPKMVKMEAIKLAGFVLKTKTENSKHSIPKFWGDYVYGEKQKKLQGEPFLKSHAEYGACFPGVLDNDEFDYVIGVEVKDGYDILKDYHVCTIPESMYAVFSTPPADEADFVSSIQGTWKYIFSEWFPNSGYEYKEKGIDFELYGDRCQGETGKVIDIYVPVVKREV